MNRKQKPHLRLAVQSHQFIPRLRITLLLGCLLALLMAFSQPVHAQLGITTAQPAQMAPLRLASLGYQQNWVADMGRQAAEAFRDEEFQLARRLWLALAQQGEHDAAYRLGMLYDTGTGVTRDPSIAANWYQQAARDGHLDAQHNLAVAYANGEGVEMNITQAMYWWKRAAQRGNADSQYNLGIVYAMGVHGIKRNLDNAKKWWRKAAIKGDPMAQYNLGTLYANGEGHVRSYCEATRWWEKSARRGVQQASWALQIIKQRDDYKACW